MRAILYHRYGPPDVLRSEEAETPAARESEVLIRVHAASVNPYDWHFMRGEPYLLRLMAGLGRPKDPRLGVDLAGDVEAIGKSVTQFKPGDPVFGMGRGAFAEYACAAESALALKPENVTFEQAASVGIAGLTALQGLRDKGHVRAGQRVLINGAAGGVGSYAVQIAKSFGAQVTGVCSSRNVALVQSLGADRVVDYTREDFATSGERHDAILDCVGNRSLAACGRALSPGGIYVGVGGNAGRWMIGPLLRMMAALALSAFGSRKFVSFIANPRKEDLTLMHDLMRSGKVTPIIDRRYTLSDAPDAIRYQEEGHARGKVVISVV
jgi:NADPH:quinone reductase-like Zn-dependent oxidoreductase